MDRLGDRVPCMDDHTLDVLVDTAACIQNHHYSRGPVKTDKKTGMYTINLPVFLILTSWSSKREHLDQNYRQKKINAIQP